MFNKKIHFKCTDPKYLNIYPPIESRKIPRPCLKKFNDHYKNSLETLNKPTCRFAKLSNTAKCPGILGLISDGYILRLHRDIRITTTESDQPFKCEYLITDDPQDKPMFISPFTPNLFGNYYNLPEYSLKTIIKVALPWGFESKKYDFISLQPSYLEENRFTVINGLINSENSMQLNALLIWNKLNCTEILKAGTPLCHLIPVQKNINPKITFSIATKKDLNLERSKYFAKKLTNYN
jgi:hypothetical protein